MLSWNRRYTLYGAYRFFIGFLCKTARIIQKDTNLEPLEIYAVCAGKCDRFFRGSLYKPADSMGLGGGSFRFSSPEQLMSGPESQTLPYNCIKIRKSFVPASGRRKNEDDIKELLRGRSRV